MRRSDVLDLVLLAALWGGSFLFMRIAVPEFGALAMVEVRTTTAALFLLALLYHRGKAREMTGAWRGIAFVGFVTSAIPFILFAYSMLALTAGFGAILNATSPLFGAVIAFLWLRERLPLMRVIGLAIGFGGVALLVLGKPSFAAGGEGWAIACALLASLSYGIGPSFTKRNLAGISPLSIATGSQVAAAIFVLPLAIVAWPENRPSLAAWSAAAALGVLCTGIAYILYFRLIANVGPTRAISVTFLIPAFGMFWGAVFLSEPVTLGMLAGCAVILFGTALATGVIAKAARAAAAGEPKPGR
jgi:drug/metabolite transporter (DMT)-like permease